MRHAVSGMMSRGDPDNGSSGNPHGQDPDKKVTTGQPTPEDPAVAAESGIEVANSAENMSASDGSDTAGGPARGDFRVG
jgi:hypothetical protein